MSRLKLTKQLLFIIPLALFSYSLSADDEIARKIMIKVDQREDGKSRTADINMILLDKKGNRRLRKIRSYTKDVGQDVYSIMFFDKPADVNNIGFLSYDYDRAEKIDDQWLYLPALKKTKRISSHDKSGSFMGSDFNYSDMTSMELADYDFKLIKESSLNEYAVWIIEAIPVDKEVIDRIGYKRKIIFVRKDNYVVIRGVSWSNTGGKVKYFDTKKIDLIDGIWTPTRISMTTKKGKQKLHTTLITYKNIQYNQALEESTFTVRRLEQGI